MTSSLSILISVVLKFLTGNRYGSAANIKNNEQIPGKWIS